jgi:hypothetical protein
MNEDQKLEDAAHCLDEMIAVQNDPVAFRRKLSAFLGSSRSVLQYAHKETKANPASRKWYKTEVSKRIIALMRDQRNTDVHEEPVSPANDVAVHIGAGLSMTGQLGMMHMNAQQEILGEYSSVEMPAVATEPPAPTAEYTYFFEGKRAEGDIISLSTSYLTELRKVVADGQARGFLTK